MAFQHLPPPKALIFDLMGTFTDWHTAIITALKSAPSIPQLPTSSFSTLAASWRAGFFTEIHAAFTNNSPPESIDITHRRVLENLLADRNITLPDWDERVREKLVAAWHTQPAWPDAIPALEALKSSKRYFIIVLANGTTRLQLDLIRSSGLPFHTLLSSELLGIQKPRPEMYERALELLGVGAGEACMVASHAYDVRAAKKVGLKTVYIWRSTEDVGIGEDFEALKSEFHGWLDGRESAISETAGGLHGLGEVAEKIWATDSAKCVAE
jgi:2-haloalkanoic acid dehalogenase type II